MPPGKSAASRAKRSSPCTGACSHTARASSTSKVKSSRCSTSKRCSRTWTEHLERTAMQAERMLDFLVVGAAPASVAIPAAAVLNVLAEREFTGTALDLRALGAASAGSSGHVLLVRG